MKNSIKILGAYGGKSGASNTTCIQVSKNILIDAGNVLSILDEEAKFIDHIFISHTHLDHILEIPFLIDNTFSEREKPLTIYGLKQTISNLRSYIFNFHIWPDFESIKLPLVDENTIIFKEIKIGETYEFEDCSLKVVQNNHTKDSCAYTITKDNSSVLFTSDTYKCPEIWEEINNNPNIKSVIIDISFPNEFEQLAKDSKHLTPKLLEEELELLKNKELSIFINHLKPTFVDTVKNEIANSKLSSYNIRILDDLDELNLETCAIYQKNSSKDYYIKQLIDIGSSLTKEKNLDALMEKILTSAKKLSNADAGTFYFLRDDEKALQFKSVQTDSLKIKLGGKSNPINWNDLPLYDENGKENNINISVKCALSKSLINIPDIYHSTKFNFEGTKSFDKNNNYTTKSMLVVPMMNHENNIVGVLQLINKKDIYNESIEFSLDDEELIMSLASQAAVIVTNKKLIDDLEKLLNSFIQSIANAIEEKSKYTGKHINRVAELTSLIAQEINEDNGRFKDIYFNKEQMDELNIAAWMHDIGKITTPEYVVDKATKLETIYDRINTVEVRFEVYKKEKEIEFLKNEISKVQFDKEIIEANEDLEFLKSINFGQFMTLDKLDRVQKISQKTVNINGRKDFLLTEDEVENLSIRRGTLNNEERFIINNHAKVSFDMLNSLPFPKKYRNVPSIAGGHHEKICGGGYPQGLKGDEISFESRILAIADVFEALTAHDRPYKKANSLNKSLGIIFNMAKEEELDAQIVKFFVEKNIHLKYAKENLQLEQMDEITHNFEEL